MRKAEVKENGTPEVEEGGNAGGKTPIVKKVTKEWKWFSHVVVGLVTAAITAMVFLIFAS